MPVAIQYISGSGAVIALGWAVLDYARTRHLRYIGADKRRDANL
jgi:hypothetical protein